MSGLIVGRGAASIGERTRQPMAIFFPFFRGADRGCQGRHQRAQRTPVRERSAASVSEEEGAPLAHPRRSARAILATCRGVAPSLPSRSSRRSRTSSARMLFPMRYDEHWNAGSPAGGHCTAARRRSSSRSTMSPVGRACRISRYATVSRSPLPARPWPIASTASGWEHAAVVLGG